MPPSAPERGTSSSFEWMGASEDAARLPIARWHAEMERHSRTPASPTRSCAPTPSCRTTLYSLTHTYVHALFGTGGEGRCSVVDARDVAAVAAAVFSIQATQGRSMTSPGPRRLHPRRIAATISKVTGRHLRYVTMSDAELAAGYHYGGLPGRLADELAAADELQAQGAYPK